MAQPHLTLGVLAVARAPRTRWGRRGYAPSGVLPAAPATPPQTRLGPPGAVETWYAGPAALVLYPGCAGHYAANLRSGRPSVWVALRAGTLEVAGVTVDPYEGEGLAGDPGLVVEAVPMPGATRSLLAAFCARHPVEEVFVKRKRTRSDPEALARRQPRVLDLRKEEE